MAFGDYIDSWVELNASGTSHTVTIATTPTSGNLLILDFVSQGNQTGESTPSGWTKLNTTTDDTNFYTGAAYYKISDGTEASVALSWTRSRETALVVAEYEGPFAVTPLDQKDEGYTSGAAPLTGLSITPTVTDSLAILTGGNRESSANGTELSFTASFAKDRTAVQGTGNDPLAFVGSLVLASTSTVSPDVDSSLSPSSFWCSGFLQNFEKGEAGSTVSPAGLHGIFRTYQPVAASRLGGVLQ